MHRRKRSLPREGRMQWSAEIDIKDPAAGVAP